MTKSGRRLPILGAADLIRVIEADGWYRVPGTKHLAWKHPTKTGKVNIDEKWRHIKPGCELFRSVLRQAGLTKKQFEDIYWRTR